MFRLKIWIRSLTSRMLLVVADIFLFFDLGDCARWAVVQGVRLVRTNALVLSERASTPEERDKLLKDSAELVQLLYDKTGEA